LEMRLMRKSSTPKRSSLLFGCFGGAPVPVRHSHKSIGNRVSRIHRREMKAASSLCRLLTKKVTVGDLLLGSKNNL
jgi:hypothetical protein